MRVCRGFDLVRELQEAGYDVLAVDKTCNSEADFLIKSGVSFAAVDITKEDTFDRLPKGGVAAVINLACAQPANMPTEERPIRRNM